MVTFYKIINGAALHIKDIWDGDAEMLLSVLVPYTPLICEMGSFHSLWTRLQTTSAIN